MIRASCKSSSMQSLLKSIRSEMLLRLSSIRQRCKIIELSSTSIKGTTSRSGWDPWLRHWRLVNLLFRAILPTRTRPYCPIRHSRHCTKRAGEMLVRTMRLDNDTRTRLPHPRCASSRFRRGTGHLISVHLWELVEVGLWTMNHSA